MKFEEYTLADLSETYSNGMEFIEDFLRLQGATELGSGACATVYKGNDCVYKVGKVTHNAAYLEYIKTISAIGSTNRFLPKIHAVRIIDGYMIVALEELNDDFKSDAFKKETGIYYGDLEDLCRYLSYGNDKRAKEVIADIRPEVLTELLAAAYVVAAAKVNTEETSFDMHSGNFMMRGKEFVITDPLVDGCI